VAKYRQPGYQDHDKPDKREKKRPPHPGGPRPDHLGPRTPRMVGTVQRARCSDCGNVLSPGADLNGQCPRCKSELHCCKQCRHFDSGARFECTQPIPKPIPKKNARNDCKFFDFRVTIEKDTAPVSAHSRPAAAALPAGRPNDARKAFDDLFKK